MAELLTQLQDQLDGISRKFFETVGVLQRDAPPVTTSDEVLVASAPAHVIDVQSNVKRMTAELMEQFKGTEQLLQLLPDTSAATPAAEPGDSSGGGGFILPVGGAAAEAAEAAFRADMQQLQAQHEEVSVQLSAAVDEVEQLLLQLQQLYAAQAQATLTAGPLPPRPQQAAHNQPQQ